MVARAATLVVVLGLGTSACSSSSSPTHDVVGDGASYTGDGGDLGAAEDGATSGPTADGAPSGSSSTDGARGDTTGPSAEAGDGSTAVPAVAGGGMAAGTAGVMTFCTQACDRAASCAAMADGGLNTTSCVSNCTVTNDEGPPNGGDVVLYRSDYVMALTACVVGTDCADTLADKAANDCQSTLATSFTAPATLVTLCQRVAASSCSQDMVSNCLTAFLPYSDATIQAITACIADPTCTSHDACVAQALTP